MIFVPRYLSPAPESTDRVREPPKPIEAFFEHAAVVILGDPGMGKTSLFQKAAENEGGQYLEVRSFLARRFPEGVQEPIYLDALDEVRVRTDDGQGVMDQIIGKLDNLGRPRFRLSCRAADWFGGLDESSLRKVSKDRKIQVLKLRSFSGEDAQTLVEDQGHDGAEFLRRAREQGFQEWLKNPQTILLLLEALTKDSWPESRQELFERACRSLVSETNPGHSHTARAHVATDSLLTAAGYLSACQVIAGNAGWSLSESIHADFPWLGELQHPSIQQDEMGAVARRRIFQQEGAEQVKPMHRTIAEYLGARFLVGQVRAGLPLTRILGMVTAEDGGVPSDLRGLYGWLSCLSRENADLLLDRDPLAIALHGDVASLSVRSQRRLLAGLRREAERDPALEIGSWDQAPLAPLVTPGLVADLRELLEDPTTPWQLTAAILDGIAAGESPQELGDLVLSLARHGPLSGRSVTAFCKGYPERVDDMKMLLQEIHRGEIRDSCDGSRTRLCESLFPEAIPASRIVEYFPTPKANEASSFYWYLQRAFLEDLPDEQIPRLLDALANWQPASKLETRARYRLLNHDLGPFFSNVLVRGLAEFGTSEEISRLYNWLGVHLKSEWSTKKSTLNESEKEPIQRWLLTHPDVHRRLFGKILSRSTANKDFHQRARVLIKSCCDKRPPGYGRLLLELAAEAADDQVAQQMFKESFTAFGPDEDGPALLNTALKLVEIQPRFKEILQTARSHPLPDYDLAIQHAQKIAQHQATAAEAKESQTQWLSERTSDLETGQACIELEKLAAEYLNLKQEPDLARVARGRRLAEVWNEEINNSALQGFIALAKHPPRVSLREIAREAVSDHFSGQLLPVHVGLQILYDTDFGAFQTLPPQELIVAFCNCLTFPASLDDLLCTRWADFLVENHLDGCAEALVEVLTPSLKQKQDHILGLSKLSAWPMLQSLVCLRLLEAFPRAQPKVLQTLIAESLDHGYREQVRHIAGQQVSKPRGLRTEQFLIWLAVAYLLDPGTYGSKFEEHAPKALRQGSEKKRADILHECVDQFTRADHQLNQNLLPGTIATLITSFTRAYPHLPIEKEGLVMPYYSVPRYAGRLIDRLGSRTDQVARKTVLALRDNPVMAPWRNYLRHILAEWERNFREHSFRRPTLPEVAQVLKNGEPTTPADLFACVVDHLEDIAQDIRDGSSDGYRSFWNEKDQWTVQSPRSEESCRDRLMERLNIALRPHGVLAEREANVADHKRADLRISHPSARIPVECKRHYHSELWTAIKKQLIPRYVRDPESGGFGIYCVFWFGTNEGKVPKPPSGIEPPQTPHELVEALKQTIPEGSRQRIAVICIDVSRP